MNKIQRPNLSVVVPAYNEELNIKKGAADRVYDYLKLQEYDWELIFVDDGSGDQTAALLDRLGKKDRRIRLIKNPHQGKAATVSTGVVSSEGEIVLFSDMDQATPIDQIEKLLPFFNEGYDVVIGSRSGRRRGAPMTRKIMALGFIVLRSLILRLPFRDTQTGFKAFSRRAADDIFGSLRIFGKQGVIRGAAVKAGFDLEVLYVARKKGYKIKEVPVEWNYKGTGRVHPIRDSIDGLKDMLRIRWYALKGAYK